MTKLGAAKKAVIALLLCTATAIAAQGQAFRTLVTFEGTNGDVPFTPLAQGTDGSLFGTTRYGGVVNVCEDYLSLGCGTIFKLTRNDVLTTLYSFDGEAAEPNGLILAANETFYGTSELDIINGGGGAVFNITRDGVLTTLYTFYSNGENDPEMPLASVIQSARGSFWGTTFVGGTNGGGTIFNITPQGVLTVVYNFPSYSYPTTSLIQGTNGDFYGTADGTIFKITSQGTLTTIYDFGGGSGFMSALTQGADGNFYGTTETTAYRMTPAGSLTTLYTFCSQPNCADGDFPSGLIQATDGNFYGVTQYGGGNGCSPSCGTVFKLTPTGTLTTLHSFNGNDGQFPVGGLVQGTNGLLYGTASNGGDYTCDSPSGCGTAFSIDMGLGPFVTFAHAVGAVGQVGGILGQGFTGTTSVSLNGTPASFTVKSDTFIEAMVPEGATTGYVTVTTPSGTLTSNVLFHVIK